MEWLQEHKSTNLDLWDVFTLCVSLPEFKLHPSASKGSWIASLYRNTTDDSIYKLKLWNNRHYKNVVFLYKNGIPSLDPDCTTDDFIMIESRDAIKFRPFQEYKHQSDDEDEIPG